MTTAQDGGKVVSLTHRIGKKVTAGFLCIVHYEHIYKNFAPKINVDNQTDLQERIKYGSKTNFMLQKFFKNKNVSKKLKLRLKNTTIDKTLTYASETWTLRKRDRKQLNIFERKVYKRILGPVYDNEKENWRILTNKEIYASVLKKPTIIETIRLNRLRWFGHVQRLEENRIPKRVLYTNLGTTILRGRPRKRWQR